MALADSLPGISGGTIAYILGFYDNLLTSLNNLLSKNKLDQKTAIKFLIQLISGWIVGLFLSILILSSLFSTHIYFMSSLLIGLTLSSIPLILIDEKNIFKTNTKSILKYIFFFIIGFICVILISTNEPEAENNIINLANIDLYLGFKIFIAGILAISTMILPGISGSSLLVIFKLYIPIITALKQLINLNFNYLLSIIIFCLGILVGAITSVKIVKKALSKHRTSTISFIVGLIIAAIYSIIIGPTSLEIPKAPLSIATFNILGFLLGVFIIYMLHKLQKNKKKNTH